MSRIAFVDGRYLPYANALVHVEDRAYQFADGVYEVCEVLDGHLVDETRHMARLERSLRELQIRSPMGLASLGIVLRETVRRNQVTDGLVYLQVSRGVARRDFIFPPVDTRPVVVCLARSVPRSLVQAAGEAGIAVITMPDLRWKRPDIKSVSLLPNALARQAAIEEGAKEAWLVDEDGFVTEGAASNAWIVDHAGQLVTRAAEFGILRGVTRAVVLDLAAKEGLQVVERAFSVDEAMQAREAFITSASNMVMAVVRIDGRTIGNGRPGSFAEQLRAAFHDHAEIAP